jgi:hypothetical protein
MNDAINISFSESSNTYALEDLTKVTPYLAPDLLQSTLGTANGGNTSMQFRLPARRSSVSNQHFVSTPLGPARANKAMVPIAKFDDDPSFVLNNSLGFQQQQKEKQLVDMGTDPQPELTIERHDFACQMTPDYCEQSIETTPIVLLYQSIQTELLHMHDIACQMSPAVIECCSQTSGQEQHDFTCQFMPASIDQSTHMMEIITETQECQTESSNTIDAACQFAPMSVDREIETIVVETHDTASQASVSDTNEGSTA